LSNKICKAEGCNDPAIVRGLCSKHYQQWWHDKNPKKAKIHRKTWRTKHIALRNGQRIRNYKRGAKHTFNSGQPYNRFEDMMILNKTITNDGKKITRINVKDIDLAQCLGRSVEAIQGQRCILKKSN